MGVGAVSISTPGPRPHHTQEGKTLLQAASLCNQLLHHFPRNEFAAIVKRHGPERSAKGFASWTQFVSMLFCQMGCADSVRQICIGLSCHLGKVLHFGTAKSPCRSTLSYTNEHHPAALCEDLFWTSLARFRDSGAFGHRQHKFRFKDKLLSQEATTIALCLNLLPWVQFRRIEEQTTPEPTAICVDPIIRRTSDKDRKGCPYMLRRVVVWVQKEDVIVLLTNHMEFGVTTIATIYKNHWTLALIFKATNENLTVKTFVGTSESALPIQIWTARIALLLLKWLHHLSSANWSLSNLASLLRLNLFTYGELTKCLKHPLETAPLPPPPEQLIPARPRVGEAPFR